MFHVTHNHGIRRWGNTAPVIYNEGMSTVNRSSNASSSSFSLTLPHHKQHNTENYPLKFSGASCANSIHKMFLTFGNEPTATFCP